MSDTPGGGGAGQFRHDAENTLQSHQNYTDMHAAAQQCISWMQNTLDQYMTQDGKHTVAFNALSERVNTLQRQCGELFNTAAGHKMTEVHQNATADASHAALFHKYVNA
ncbi:hypothetical protein P0W64_16535 [Tsukamurella sp. 8F]|uniref:hypothetical protein n=1 Tax=unclassified Tsukamurella TaxID=2633480 RepID=UPI0023BA2C11|nr:MULTISPECIES: hypothetical protein [unclassified Tsukamurella]MDF0531143.1 hypothetical protein [Tsukamurella sp. 8J]MDF0588389.1 hypothetical protein [Tsukamurella sp. 8F]